MGDAWEGGDMAMGTGGGQKVMLLRRAMEELKDEKDLIVMFVDRWVGGYTDKPWGQNP